MAEVEYGGLTHSCADPECHVEGFIKTLRKRAEEHDLAEVGRVWDTCACGWYGSDHSAHQQRALGLVTRPGQTPEGDPR